MFTWPFAVTDDAVRDLKGSMSPLEKGSVHKVHKGIREVHSGSPDRFPVSMIPPPVCCKQAAKAGAEFL